MRPEGRLKLREPFSSVSHLAGAGLFVAGLIVLIVLSHGQAGYVVSFLVYGLCAIALYSASGIYHSSHKAPELLQRLDHMAIYLMIAGTYTPVCVVGLPKPEGWWVLGAEWGMAAIGLFANLALKGGPHWLRIVLYLGMGWLAVSVWADLGRVLTPAGLGWLVAGGLVYTIGTAVYASERPKLWPGVFGAHDLWHVFVLAASACHYMVMLILATKG
jgi:hemolysin III